MRKIFRNPLLGFVSGLTFILLLTGSVEWRALPDLVHWPTMITLTGLLITTTGLQQSGLINRWAHRLVRSLHTERTLWFVLILFSAFSAMFLTNDIALLLIIPFTLNLREHVSFDLSVLLIFETIAVNVGSALTPIGNPQNIFLWQQSGLSFGGFIHVMLVPTLIQLGLLIVAIFYMTNTRSLTAHFTPSEVQVDYKLAGASCILMIAFLIAGSFGLGLYALLVVVAIYLLFYRHALRHLDWPLILLFIALFVDTGIIASFHFWGEVLRPGALSHPFQTVVAGAGLSQLISNVPAALLLSHFTDQWNYLAWGVNIGGNGLIMASFANLITLRLAKSEKIGWRYHYYAIPFLMISLLLTYLWIII